MSDNAWVEAAISRVQNAEPVTRLKDDATLKVALLKAEGATAKIEELIHELSNQFTIVIVTHSMQQAARVSNRTAYFHLGKLVEVGETAEIFSNPSHEMTTNYITGRFG